MAGESGKGHHYEHNSRISHAKLKINNERLSRLKKESERRRTKENLMR